MLQLRYDLIPIMEPVMKGVDMTGNQTQALLFKTSVLAGIAGAGVALLLAPKSGRETREKLRQTATKVQQRTSRAKDKTEDMVHLAAEEVQQSTSPQAGFYGDNDMATEHKNESNKERE